MEFSRTEITVLAVMGAVLALLVAAIVWGTWHHVYRAKFKPRFVRLSDGSLRMDFKGFGGLQSARTRRFLAQYRVGMEVPYGGRRYRIVDIKQVAEVGLARPDVRMTAYLEEI